MPRYCRPDSEVSAAVRARVLLVDLEWSDCDIDKRGLDVSVSHQLHQRGQADAGPHHIGGEGVTEAVWVGERDAGGLAMVAEEGA